MSFEVVIIPEHGTEKPVYQGRSADRAEHKALEASGVAAGKVFIRVFRESDHLRCYLNPGGYQPIGKAW